MKAYRDVLTIKAARPDGHPIPCSGPEQAAAALQMFFSIANRSMRIVTGGLNARIYGQPPVIAEAKRFLADGSHTLEIIFLEPVDNQKVVRHPLLAEILGWNNVHLFRINPSPDRHFGFHFTLADDNLAYRFKEDVDKHASIVAFGDAKFSSTLLNAFRRLRSNSEKFEVPALTVA
jgi:hypothetical protein